MIFRNREQAAALLAERLSGYRGKRPLVLGVPRGAVPMAAIIADALDGELDVVLVHKLGAPGQPELAIGAVDETGQVYVSEYARELGADADYLREETERQVAVLRKRRESYTPVRPPIDPAGRIVIVVDDGVATGSSMIAALRALHLRKPARLVVAIGVAPPDTLRQLEKNADEIVCLAAPDGFYAVGQWFEDFSQVSDDQVVATLRDRGARPRMAQETESVASRRP